MGKKLFVLFIILVAMLITNPTKEDFTNWVKEQAESKSSSVLEKGVVSLLGSAVIDASTVRHDYYIFSLYEINTDVTGNNSKPNKYVGAFKVFVAIPS